MSNSLIIQEEINLLKSHNSVQNFGGKESEIIETLETLRNFIREAEDSSEQHHSFIDTIRSLPLLVESL